MGITRSNDPLQWDQVDGIVINESAPPPTVQGVAVNVGILVATAQRGPKALTELTSNDMKNQLYGADKTKGLDKVLKNKAFGRLKMLRVVADDAVKALKIFNDGGGEPVDIIKFIAKYEGLYGNSLTVKIEAGSTAGKKYTITDGSVGAVLPPEIYDNVQVANIANVNPFAKSKLIDVVVLATSAEPAVAVATALATGSDGTVGDTDYEDAIALAQVSGAGNVIFLDAYNATRNGYIKSHLALMNDKMGIIQGAADDDSTDANTAAATMRDTDGRIIYAFNDAVTSVDGEEVVHPAAWWIASIFTQCPPQMDLAYKDNSKYLAGIIRLVNSPSPAEYVLMNKAGVCALEYDEDLGFKVKSSVTTQILDSSKVTILRRRMTDFLTVSLAKYLKNYQNAVNSATNRKIVKAGIVKFDAKLESDGIVPSDSEMTDGAKAKQIDTEDLAGNTNDSIAAGFLKVLYRRRIYSSMRYIVLSAEIGESVVVTEVA